MSIISAKRYVQHLISDDLSHPILLSAVTTSLKHAEPRGYGMGMGTALLHIKPATHDLEPLSHWQHTAAADALCVSYTLSRLPLSSAQAHDDSPSFISIALSADNLGVLHASTTYLPIATVPIHGTTTVPTPGCKGPCTRRWCSWSYCSSYAP